MGNWSLILQENTGKLYKITCLRFLPAKVKGAGYCIPPLSRLKVNRWGKVLHENGNKKKARVAILIADKTDFKTKAVTRQRRPLYNNKGINPTRGHSTSKYLCTQNRST